MANMNVVKYLHLQRNHFLKSRGRKYTKFHVDISIGIDPEQAIDPVFRVLSMPLISIFCILSQFIHLSGL